MAIRKSDLYSSLWASCDELRGGRKFMRLSLAPPAVRGRAARLEKEIPRLMIYVEEDECDGVAEVHQAWL